MHIKDNYICLRAVIKGYEVVQQTDNYPYGLPIATSTGAAANRYKYGDTRSVSEPFERMRENEFETRAGLNSLDFHARQYAPALPFFDVLDPKSWDYPGYNPYLYCAANPIMNTDPTGKDIYRFDEDTGDIVLMQKTDDKFDQIGDYDYNKKTKEYTLKTDRKGNAKTKINKIEKGILKDGINFKSKNNTFEIKNDGGVTSNGLLNFAEELQNLVGREISGIILEGQDGNGIVFLGKYENNRSNRSELPGFSDILEQTGLNLRTVQQSFPIRTHWHTHPRCGNRVDNTHEPSAEDLISKCKNSSTYNRFWIIHRSNKETKFYEY